MTQFLLRIVDDTKQFVRTFPYKFVLWTLLPLFLTALCLVFLSEHATNYAKELVDLLLSLVLVLAVGFLLPGRWLKRAWLLVAALLIAIATFFKLSFYYLYQTKLTLSAFYILFETNPGEASGFLGLYFNFFLLFLLLLLLFGVWIQGRYLFSGKAQNGALFRFSLFRRDGAFVSLALLLAIFVSGYVIQLKLRPFNLYFMAQDAHAGYTEMQQVFQSHLAQPEHPAIGRVVARDEAQTYVVVIGESTSALNMSLYGYERKTNPLLEEIAENLWVFVDVVAPHAHTIPSLNKALTFSNYENPDAIEKGSAMQVANAAGFETYWISNQQPLGIYENMVTVMAKACDHQVFLNEDNMQYGKYDEYLLPELEKALKNPGEKKLIFLHLMGTHSPFKFRYPDAYNLFEGTTDLVASTTKKQQFRNEYDNAVLYTDFVVRGVIDRVQAQEENSVVIYFSDHGEEVFHEIDYLGHNEYHITEAMMRIPFVVWTSDAFRTFNPVVDSLPAYTQRKYLLDDFIHSLFDLSRIRFDALETSRSLFSPDFEDRKRILRKNVDFDER